MRRKWLLLALGIAFGFHRGPLLKLDAQPGPVGQNRCGHPPAG
jgi:hypothetical protein